MRHEDTDARAQAQSDPNGQVVLAQHQPANQTMEGEQQKRLILSNWTSQQTKILTPKNLAVFDFKPDPQGNFLLFSAADTSQGVAGISDLKLYKVSTQFDGLSKVDPKIELVLDNQQYQNNKFDISQDGKTIVVQRLNRNSPQDYGLWKIADGKPFTQILKTLTMSRCLNRNSCANQN